MPVRLANNRYGKHRVRVSKVRRPRQAPPNEETHELVEFAVDVELAGDFEAAYTDGDNSQVVATDTCKNTVYVLAKDHPLDSPESFGVAIAGHFLQRYPHVAEARASLTETVWSRLGDSPHGFVAQQQANPTATVTQTRGKSPVVTAGIKKLSIAKTTESGFVDFHRDEFRTLADTDDRILATELSASWTYKDAQVSGNRVDFAACRTRVTDALVARFVDHYSRSVQETLYLMAESALAACPEVAPFQQLTQITLTMPNKHHLLVNLAPFGRENENEVFAVTDEPFGYITATVVAE